MSYRAPSTNGSDQMSYRVTAHDVIHINQCKFSCKFTSAWQARLAYKCVPYSSHSYSSSKIAIHMDAFPLGLYYCYASLWKKFEDALQSEWFSLNLPCGSECHCSRSVEICMQKSVIVCNSNKLRFSTGNSQLWIGLERKLSTPWIAILATSRYQMENLASRITIYCVCDS